MSKISAAIASLRLRTLPLSLSGIAMGTMLAISDYQVKPDVVILLCLCAASLQVLSNLSNELGDVLHGTDTENRQGPLYGFNSGDLNLSDMKRLVGIFVVISIVIGLAMIKSSFGTFFSLEAIMTALLGAAAILAALKYTLGRNPYGYRGLGDIFVFIFFGGVTVLGSYFIAAHTIPSRLLIFPAASIGFFSVGVLNVNNIRDIKTDSLTRSTIAIKLGLRGARIYQTILITLGWLSMILYCLNRFQDPWHYLFFLTLPLFIIHVIGVWKKQGVELDKMLPLLVMSTFIFALLSGVGFLVFLF